MRTSRIKIQGQAAVYHCICRCVAKEMLLDDRSKEVFRKQMHTMADFCGVQILTYCLMTNHVHLLIRVPEPQPISDQELVRRYALLYGKYPGRVATFEQLLKEDSQDAKQERARQLKRMGDISFFMKELKQRFGIWYNKSHHRIGTLWTERFKSLLVQNSRTALMTLAAYIELNPVRAGLCEDPKDYRFCGYAEALGGEVSAQQGIAAIAEVDDWKVAAQDYRMTIFGKGAGPKSSAEAIPSQKMQKVMRAGGKLPRAVLLRCRVRYFTDGAILGSKEFVQEVFEQHKDQLGVRRWRTSGKTLPGAEWEGLRSFRDLRRRVFG